MAPINKIVKSKRSIASIAAALAIAATAGWQSSKDTTPAILPPAVILATDTLILPWEGMVLSAHWDKFAKIYDICAGITRINGKPVTKDMRFTRPQCERMTREQIYFDYYLPLTKQIRGFTAMPISVQASMLSGAYNFGVAAMVRSTAARHHMAGNYRAGCEAQVAFNRAGGQVVNGLVKRREMGDAQRQGEAELCVSGLPS